MLSWSRQKLIPGEKSWRGNTEGKRWKPPAAQGERGILPFRACGEWGRCKLIVNWFLGDLQWSCSEIAVLAFPRLKICQESCSNLEPRSKRIPWPRYWVGKWITHLFSSFFGHFYLWLLPWGLSDIPELWSAHALGLVNGILGWEWESSGNESFPSGLQRLLYIYNYFMLIGASPFSLVSSGSPRCSHQNKYLL